MLQRLEDKTRAAILQSIREHLAASGAYDSRQTDRADFLAQTVDVTYSNSQGTENGDGDQIAGSEIEIFRTQVEDVGGHCFVAADRGQAARTVNQICAELKNRGLQLKRIALSDAPLVSEIVHDAGIDAEVITKSPMVAELFDYDVGICSAQAAIAETGTLILQSDKERNRLVSLVPPVHIAMIIAGDIYPTLGDALRYVCGEGQTNLSRAITFITGPSRTADIELTLTIGVHGPKELYVIVIA